MWKILVVDDESDVIALSRLMLGNKMFLGQGVEIYSALSLKEAKQAISNIPGIALVLLDLVMESENSGFEFIDYVRNKLENKVVRFIIRTGGHFTKTSSEKIVGSYDIHDYLEKTDLPRERFFIVITCALRYYEQMVKLENNIQEVQKERNMLSGIINNIPEHVFVKNTEGKLLISNRNSNDTYLQEASSQNNSPYLKVENSSIAEDKEILTNQKKIIYREEEHLVNDHQRWLHITKVPWIDEYGDILGLIGLTRDITEQREVKQRILNLNKALEQHVKERTLELQDALLQLEARHRELQHTQTQLVHSEKMAGLGTLVAGLAHEINNPVNFVQTGAQNIDVQLTELKNFIFEIAGDDASDSLYENFESRFRKLFDFLNTIHNGSKRIKTILADLKNFSHLNEAERKTVHIVENLESTLRLAQTKYKQHVDFKCDFQANPSLTCWPAQLNQVFMHIIVNACHSINEKRNRLPQMPLGDLSIKTHFIKDRVAIAFQDNGCGMSEEIQDKIFEPFFTTKPVGKGVGLGMSISYGIIESHQGSIEVQSELNKGTTITVLLPLQETLSLYSNTLP